MFDSRTSKAINECEAIIIKLTEELGQLREKFDTANDNNQVQAQIDIVLDITKKAIELQKQVNLLDALLGDR